MRQATKNEMKALRLYATDVAGTRARLVMRALEGRVWVHIWEDQPAELWFNEAHDPRPFEIEKMVFPGNACPFVWVHEFGHAYHCYYWRERSAVMPEENGEAVSLLFEHELAAYAERYEKQALLELWRNERQPFMASIRESQAKAFDILEQMLQTRNTDFHALVGRIVACGGS